LHSSSKKHQLPWHRVINSKGLIALKSIDDKQYQKKLLELEGIEVKNGFKIDLNKYLWDIDSIELLENLGQNIKNDDFII
jgi:methylated-DNA-protein-cysteine methyltransferase-like protein